MCQLDSMIKADAVRFGISLSMLKQLHKEYHRVNGSHPPNDLLELLEVVT